MKRTVGLLFLIVFGLFGCSTHQPRSYLTYQLALQEMHTRGFAATQNLFVKACEQKSQAGCLASGQLEFAQVPHTLSILQGLTTADSTQLSLMVPKDIKVELYLWDLNEKTLIAPVRKTQLAREHSPWGVIKIAYSRLQTGRNYRLDVVDDRGELLDSRELAALNLKTDQVKFAVASCMDDGYKKEQGPMWQALLSQNPQLLFLIGDNVYADKGLPPKTPANPIYLWKRYTEMRLALDLYRAPHLVPILATWDDHDFGQNDSDRRYPYKAESAEIFQTFFAQEADGEILKKGPGVSTRLSAFGHRFYLVDDRSFRTPADAPQAEQSHYGPEQTEWLFKDMASVNSPIFLLQGDQFFGAYHQFESFAGNHPQDFAQFLRSLRKITAPVFLISGDRHMAELMEIAPKEIGYKTYELTTSGIHAKVPPANWDKQPNPRQIAGAEQVFNFAIVESTARSRHWTIQTRVLGPEARVLFERELQIQK